MVSEQVGKERSYINQTPVQMSRREPDEVFEYHAKSQEYFP